MSIVEKAVSRLGGGRPKKPEAPPAHPDGADRRRGVGTLEGRRVDAPRVAVDRDRLRGAGFLAPEEYERRLAEEYRRIKRPLLANAFGLGAPKIDFGNLIIVASARSGEGKTHTCINLALSMAMEKERTVLLVDGDVAKPTVSGVFGVDDAPGLLDVLEPDGLPIEDCILTTDIPGLRLLPAGAPREGATELLASDRMRALAAELSGRYSDRIVLFDSPPLLDTSESIAIAAVVGQVALVVAAGVTPQSAVRDAVGQLNPEQAVNVILNKQRFQTSGGYYGSYGYGYGYGHQERERQSGPQ